MVNGRAITYMAILPERHKDSGAVMDWSFHWETGTGTDRCVNASSRASAPNNGTRRGRTRSLSVGPVTSHAAPTGFPQPAQRITRSALPTVALPS